MFVVVAALILAGCGGSAHVQAQTVAGTGVSFQAPAGWTVTTSHASVAAAKDSQLLQVATFPLVKPYSDALFDKVTRELDVRMQTVAKQLGGMLSGPRTVTAGGIRSHQYVVTTPASVLEYTFVLRDMKEYELLCRRPSSSGDAACAQLVRTFVPR